MSDQNQILKQAKEALDKAIDEARRNRSFLNNVGPAIVDMLRPILNKIVDNLKTDGIENAIKQMRIEISPEVKIPEIKIPKVEIPLIKVPKPEVTVNIPPIKIPKIEIPKFDFPNELEVSLKREFDYKNPMPVILMDDKGNPYLAISGGGSGGNIIRDILEPGGSSVLDTTNQAVRSYLVATASGFNASVNVVGFTASVAVVPQNAAGTPYDGGFGLPVNIVGSTGSTAVSVVDSTGVAFEGANAFPITGTITGITNSVAVNVVDSTGVAFEGANAFPITGTITGITNSVAVSIVDSTGVAFEGANGLPITGTLTAVTNITNSIATSLIDSTGVQYSGSNPLPIVGPVVVTSITNSVASALIDSTGVGYSGSNPLPIVGPIVITSITNTTSVVGNINSYVADDETPPVKVGGIARTTNPTKASDGNRISQTYDAVGRALVRPVQVRGLVQTAYVSVSTGTETTLLAGIANTFLDLVYIIGTNSSDAAVTVDLRSATAAGIQTSIRIPANGTAGVSLTIPIPQDVAADTWTVDLPDITGTTVTIGALFSKEV